ncbi:sigma-70 family RNA polymerase sigma factor [Rossellomorea aquimaris]|uniref:sigma-70 family RNA polymerase sigma factor n=1 Tax=Rossellomorea aquimaris TaxID=189382 RepID=UPI0007D09E49|nr:sigma-70 family RNA polymerase sigma factor [Rossellomorea aquimaris]
MDVKGRVKKAKKGNKDALVELIMNQKDDYYRLAYVYMGNEHDALDAMEEMIVQLYENIHQLKKAEAFYSWSKTILVNRCKTILRRKKKVVLVEDWQQDISHIEMRMEAPNGFIEIEQRMDINQLLEKLNPNQAEAIRLKYFLDYDYQTISEITQVSVGTVKSRTFQGLKKMKDLYGGENDE